MKLSHETKRLIVGGLVLISFYVWPEFWFTDREQSPLSIAAIAGFVVWMYKDDPKEKT